MILKGLYFMAFSLFFIACGFQEQNFQNQESNNSIKRPSQSKSNRNKKGKQTSEMNKDKNPSKYPSSQSTDKYPSTIKDDVIALVQKQNKNFGIILAELNNNEKKITHWIWWVFPTEKKGASEPLPKTAVSLDSISYFLSHSFIDKWSSILEKINDLLHQYPLKNTREEKMMKPNPRVIPAIDHGRIHYALSFFLNDAIETTKNYPRFYKALKNLNKFEWR